MSRSDRRPNQTHKLRRFPIQLSRAAAARQDQHGKTLNLPGQPKATGRHNPDNRPGKDAQGARQSERSDLTGRRLDTNIHLAPGSGRVIPVGSQSCDAISASRELNCSTERKAQSTHESTCSSESAPTEPTTQAAGHDENELCGEQPARLTPWARHCPASPQR